MSAADLLAAQLLRTDRFRAELSKAACRRVARVLLHPPSSDETTNWSYLLSCASVFALSDDQEALDAALRVMESALVAPDATEAHKAAAVLLLDRVGNSPAIGVAQRKHGISQPELADYPAPLRLEVVRSRLEFAVPTSDGRSVPVSKFQRQMWTALRNAQWVSASAPTSTGKSRIIRMWLRDTLETATGIGDETTRLAVVVPTRALVDEVSADLRSDLPPGVQVTTLPWDARATQAPAEVFVMTQERLHLLQQRFPDLTFDVVFVDEAQKLGDGARGVLLQQVVDEAVRRRPGMQMIFASPLTEDPEVLLDAAPERVRTATVDSRAVTVTQNLLYANQVRGHRQLWDLDLLLHDEPIRLGQFTIPAVPDPESTRLPLVAVALARGEGGNVVYVNTAADAEKAAQTIASTLGPDADVSDDPAVGALIELVERTIDPRYSLATVLRRGVAFHYGNMPQLVRTEVEKLFREDKIRFLVCTSTLLEGVNLPCKSLFVRGPKRGNANPMTASDFWNLAGRAGRWGMELEGNIVCVDTSQPDRWVEVPRRRVRQRIRRETAVVLRDATRLAAWIDAGAPTESGMASAEAVYSFLAARVAVGVHLADLPALGASPEELALVEAAVSRSLRHLDFPTALIGRHAGISPLAMQRLLDQMRALPPHQLQLAPARSRGSWESYARAFGVLVTSVGADFGGDRRQNQLAVLVVAWMTGQPLSQLVSGRLRFEATRTGHHQSTATVIRDVMRDVETVARFLAPKYLACYVDLMKVHFEQTGRHDLADAAPRQLEMQLELGVSSETQLSLMALGVSRTSAVELYSLMTQDDLSPAQVLAWIGAHESALDSLPRLVAQEVADMVQREGDASGERTLA